MVAGIKIALVVLFCVLLHLKVMSDNAPAPCGCCSLDVVDKGILCEKCLQWYHPICQDIGDDTYDFLGNNPDFSWDCLACGSPNHTTSVNLSPISSFSSNNSFEVLDSPPSQKPVESKPIRKFKGSKLSKIKLLNVNAQSLNKDSKKDQFLSLLDQHKPDGVIVTETWLSPSTYSSEIIPDELGYTTYRKDRGSRGGGVLILISSKYISNRETQFETNCEIIWVRLEIAGSKPMHIAAYYKPKEADSQSEFKRSLELVSSTKGHVWILGDFNLPKFNWDDNTPTIKEDCKYSNLYEEFTVTLDDHNLTQMVNEPTRGENVLDLFLTNNPSLVSNVSIIPGIADHDIVCSEVNIRPQTVKQVPRLMHVYKRTDWVSLEQHMTEFKDRFLASHEGKSVNKLWSEFKTALETGIDKYVPKKTLSSKASLPWVTQDIKRKIRKRDSLFQKYKRTRSAVDRTEFIDARNKVKRMLKTSHDRYVEDILDLAYSDDPDSPKSTYTSKKLFSMLKRTKQDSSGLSPLLKDDCGTPVIGNGTYTIVEDGKLAVLKCNTHYKLVGDVHPVIIKCVNGTWTKPHGTCSQECPKGFLLHNDRCFFVSKLSKTWEEANEICKVSGGHLAKIDSADLQKLLDDNIKAAKTAESSTIVVGTPEEAKYQFLDDFGFTLTGQTGFVFHLKAATDGFISLSHDMADPLDFDNSDMDEIIIGGFHGTKSVIRSCFQCYCDHCDEGVTDKTLLHMPLDKNAFKKFWVSWSGGIVKFGPGHNIGENQFLEWPRDDPHAVNHIAIFTAYGNAATGPATGTWKFPVNCFMPGEFWLGARRTSGTTFRWLPSHDPLDYTNWDTATGQPDNDEGNQDCMFLNRDMKWMDGFCKEKRNYICEKPISG